MANSWDFYNKHGDEYFRHQLEFSHRHGRLEPDRKWLRSLCLEKVRLGHRYSHESIVDIGCGAGRDLTFWNNKFVTTVGVEPSCLRTHARETASILDRKTVTRGEQHRVRVVDGHFGKLPLEDASVSCAVARYSLHLANDLTVAFAEVARVLKHWEWFIFSVPHPAYHAYLAQQGKVDQDGMLQSSLFGGKFTAPNPARTSLCDYLGPAEAFFQGFEMYAYEEPGIAGDTLGVPTGLVCAFRKK